MMFDRTRVNEFRTGLSPSRVDGTGFDCADFDDTASVEDWLAEGERDDIRLESSEPDDIPFGAMPFRDVLLADIDIGGRGVSRPAVGALGRALRVARRQKYLSQAELAKRVGVHQTQVSKLELGAPDWALFCKLIKALGGEPVVTVTPLDPVKEKWERLRASVW